MGRDCLGRAAASEGPARPVGRACRVSPAQPRSGGGARYVFRRTPRWRYDRKGAELLQRLLTVALSARRKDSVTSVHSTHVVGPESFAEVACALDTMDAFALALELDGLPLLLLLASLAFARLESRGCDGGCGGDAFSAGGDSPWWFGLLFAGE